MLSPLLTKQGATRGPILRVTFTGGAQGGFQGKGQSPPFHGQGAKRSLNPGPAELRIAALGKREPWVQRMESVHGA